MKIILTNDDGIDAPGLETLARCARKAGDVIIVAVLEERQRTGELDAQAYEAAVADLDRRYDEMLERLDGSYQIPKGKN